MHRACDALLADAQASEEGRHYLLAFGGLTLEEARDAARASLSLVLQRLEELGFVLVEDGDSREPHVSRPIASVSIPDDGRRSA